MAHYEGQHDVEHDYYTIGLNTDFSFPLHMHRCFEITIVLEGQMNMRCGAKDYILQKGDMIFAGSNCIHNQQTVEHNKCFICIFSPDLVAAVAPWFMKYSLKSPVLRNVDDISFKMFDILYENYEKKKKGEENLAAVKGALYTLMGLFYNQLDFSSVSVYADQHILLGKMFDYVGKNMDKPCALGELAAELKYTSVYLSRFFHQNTGMPYHAYVRMVKMNHACYLLRNTRESVLDVSIHCGYNSLSGFNRIFKKSIGQTPTEYRAKNVKSNDGNNPLI